MTPTRTTKHHHHMLDQEEQHGLLRAQRIITRMRKNLWRFSSQIRAGPHGKTAYYAVSILCEFYFVKTRSTACRLLLIRLPKERPYFALQQSGSLTLWTQHFIPIWASFHTAARNTEIKGVHKKQSFSLLPLSVAVLRKGSSEKTGGSKQKDLDFLHTL